MIMRKNLTIALFAAIGAVSIAAQPAAQPAAKRTLVRAGHLLDVKTGKLLDGETILEAANAGEIVVVADSALGDRVK